MPREKRREGQRALHHDPRRRSAAIIGIHIAEMDFPFICDRGAAQQPVIAVEQDGIDAVFRQRQRNATSLKATSQNRDTHICRLSISNTMPGIRRDFAAVYKCSCGLNPARETWLDPVGNPLRPRFESIRTSVSRLARLASSRVVVPQVESLVAPF